MKVLLHKRTAMLMLYIPANEETLFSTIQVDTHIYALYWDDEEFIDLGEL